jgi:hypothetical protein
MDLDQHTLDEFTRRQNEAQAAAEAKRLADRAAVFKAEEAKLRATLAPFDMPADWVEEKVGQLRQAQQERASKEDKPLEEKRQLSLAWRFGIRTGPEFRPGHTGEYRRK